jgi:uncharacterized protein (TIGR02145 family)
MKLFFTPLFFLLTIFMCLNTNAQDIIYTITGEINNQKTQLDSIAVENISKQTHFGFGNLPAGDQYRLNLTSKKLLGTTSVQDFRNESSLRLVKNLPGTLTVGFNGQTAVNASIALYNINGQRLTFKENQVLENGSLIEAEIGTTGFYFLTISTPNERQTFKATGILNGGNMSIATLIGTAIPLKSIDGIDIQKGDMVKVMAYKAGYVAQPIELTVNGNETLVFPLEMLKKPVVQTLEATNISSNSATLQGNLLSDGNSTVTELGFYWSATNENPGEADNKIIAEGTMGRFSSELNGLEVNTTYHVRAFAMNSQGTSYGVKISFKTDLWQRDTQTAVVDVTNPATGKTWMDRNLGASRKAEGGIDAQVYGDLYQWGRAADGHQKRNSSMITTLSDTDNPGHGNFISSSSDWRTTKNDNLWQGSNGINNPCPKGYHLPTDAEWTAELQSWASNNAEGALASPLKLSMAGNRKNNSGAIEVIGSSGYYWSSTIDGHSSRYLLFYGSYASSFTTNRANGNSVRCIKD